MKKLLILGTRGLPASHGGFETFAEELSYYLLKRGWSVSIYCQEDGEGLTYESNWRGVRRIHVFINTPGAIGTIIFDWKATLHSLSEPGLLLTLGYNTALFNTLNWIKGQYNIINMDGMEWKRGKWSWYEKLWLFINEYAGAKLANVIVADHPYIKEYLVAIYGKNKTAMIAYGAVEINNADETVLKKYNLEKYGYAIVVARPEPENSILTIVKGFSYKKRGIKLIVLGNFDFISNNYHNKIQASASDEVIFPGTVYSHDVLSALRFYSMFYIHGHTVGGTNPSLVEAMGAGCFVLAQENKFNKWVLGDKGYYFKSDYEISAMIDNIISHPDRVNAEKLAIKKLYKNRFTWGRILQDYEKLLNRYV